MAKKTQKGKAVKKAVKPAKKIAAKKPAKKTAPKKVAKKPAPKKATKKVLPKKAVKPVKKAAKTSSKKPVKSSVKPTLKKVITKKIVSKKPIKKTVAKKPMAKKIAKKVMPVKKVIAKPVTKANVKKTVEKPVNKKEVQKAEIKKPVAVQPVAAKPLLTKKPEPVTKKKQRDLEAEEDDNSRDEGPMVVEYKTPSIRRPMGPTPKPHINTDTRTRYTDAELKEFKELILKKLADAQKDFELLKSTLSHKDDHGTDDTSPTFKLLEDGSDVLSKEETAHLASRQEKFIQNLQNALIRIENKTYGICRVTGKLISKERLRSVPHATLAIEAKLEQNA